MSASGFERQFWCATIALALLPLAAAVVWRVSPKVALAAAPVVPPRAPPPQLVRVPTSTSGQDWLQARNRFGSGQPPLLLVPATSCHGERRSAPPAPDLRPMLERWPEYWADVRAKLARNEPYPSTLIVVEAVDCRSSQVVLRTVETLLGELEPGELTDDHMSCSRDGDVMTVRVGTCAIGTYEWHRGQLLLINGLYMPPRLWGEEPVNASDVRDLRALLRAENERRESYGWPSARP